MNLIDGMSEFAYMLASGDDFWAGFWFCLEWVVLLWLGSLLLGWLDGQWKRVRQFFAPAKKPSKPKEEAEPSPAAQAFGCATSLLFLILGLLGVAILLGLFFPAFALW